MFAFGAVIDGEFTFVQEANGHVYTYPTESLAFEYFDCIKEHSHLYRLDSDLGVARLVKSALNANPAPAAIEPTEEQKLGLWSSFIYKSLLSWAPYPDDVTVPEEVA